MALNAHAGASVHVVETATMLAEYAIWFAPALLVLLWTWGRPEHRPALLASAISTAIALGANQVVGHFWYEPRPFMIGIGRTLLIHAPENSFPSDHTTFMLAIGMALIGTGAARYWGSLVVYLGVLIGWARIYLGVHFPIDIVTSTLIGVLFLPVAILLTPVIRRWVCPVAEEVYEWGIDLIRLPAVIFPRRRTRG